MFQLKNVPVGNVPYKNVLRSKKCSGEATKNVPIDKKCSELVCQHGNVPLLPERNINRTFMELLNVLSPEKMSQKLTEKVHKLTENYLEFYSVLLSHLKANQVLFCLNMKVNSHISVKINLYSISLSLTLKNTPVA